VELCPHRQPRCGPTAAIWRISSLIIFTSFTSSWGDQLAELLVFELVGYLQCHQ
jgi:hypothetical protein